MVSIKHLGAACLKFLDFSFAWANTFPAVFMLHQGFWCLQSERIWWKYWVRTQPSSFCTFISQRYARSFFKKGLCNWNVAMRPRSLSCCPSWPNDNWLTQSGVNTPSSLHSRVQNATPPGRPVLASYPLPDSPEHFSAFFFQKKDAFCWITVSINYFFICWNMGVRVI